MSKTPKKLKNTTVATETLKAEPAKAPSAKTVPVKAESPKPAPQIVRTPVVAAAPVAPVAPAPAKPAAPPVNRVALEFIKPEAKKVFVAGSFNGWKPEITPLTQAGEGRWVGNLAVKPGRYEYLFVVDGQWLPDPNATETVANPFGGKNSVLIATE